MVQLLFIPDGPRETPSDNRIALVDCPGEAVLSVHSQDAQTATGAVRFDPPAHRTDKLFGGAGVAPQ